MRVSEAHERCCLCNRPTPVGSSLCRPCEEVIDRARERQREAKEE